MMLPQLVGTMKSYRISLEKLDYFKSATISIVIILAVGCMLPFFMGRPTKLQHDFLRNSNISADSIPRVLLDTNFAELNGLQVQGTLIASIAATLPILFDAFLDYLFPVQGAWNNGIIPRREMFITITLSDLIILVYAIPNEEAGFLLGLINARDSLFICTFLLYMHKLSPTIMKRGRLAFVGICFTFANFINCLYLTKTIYFSRTYLNLILITIVGLALAVMTRLVLDWCRYLYKIRNEPMPRDVTVCSLYVFFFPIFLYIDWGLNLSVGGLAGSHPWASTGSDFLTVYTLAMVFMTLSITVLSTRLLRHDRETYAHDLETRKAFMRYISHEIRTPLNIVASGLRVMEDDIRNDMTPHDLIETINDIKSACYIAVETLNEVLSYDKMESKKMTLDISRFSLRSFVNSCIKPFYLQAAANNVKLELSFASTIVEDDVILSADEQKLGQVFRNLLSNALKFTPTNGSVTVLINHGTKAHLRRQDYSSLEGMSESFSMREYVMITVKDTGAGISKANQKKLFKDVVQFNPGKLQAGGGTGLGLYISKGIVDLHKGSLSVHSEGEGLGTTFTAMIPVDTSIIQRAVSARSTASGADKFRQGAKWMKSTKTHLANQMSRRNLLGSRDILSSEDNDFKPVSHPSRSNHRFSLTSLNADVDKLIISVRSRMKSSGRSGNTDPNEGREEKTLEENKSVGLSTRMAATQSTKPLRDLSTRNSSRQFSRRVAASTESANQSGVTDVEIAVPRIKNILIVDDSEANRKMLKRLLRGRCDHCDIAVDGQDAVSKVRDSIEEGFVYNVVLMDYEMPNMNGPTAAREIRKIHYDGLIIGLTGNTGVDDVNTYLNAGANHVLFKPLDLEKFDNIISQYVANTIFPTTEFI